MGWMVCSSWSSHFSWNIWTWSYTEGTRLSAQEPDFIIQNWNGDKKRPNFISKCHNFSINCHISKKNCHNFLRNRHISTGKCHNSTRKFQNFTQKMPFLMRQWLITFISNQIDLKRKEWQFKSTRSDNNFMKLFLKKCKYNNNFIRNDNITTLSYLKGKIVINSEHFDKILNKYCNSIMWHIF